ncbi:hypothetical protein [Thiohalomonas denitrificans]|uniref:Uncharacterized protein n=1 Tax=Thiohalomonas denitrificans TaxID=415747 RepID=A0A1G5Q8U7_9GAMM|nr:hypothetical protein [Thiohalomonas denitrificans]SCZ58274.1 hypothetical protein SAMN03097708_01651 [Thiohalomonas denitrificans]
MKASRREAVPLEAKTQSTKESLQARLTRLEGQIAWLQDQARAREQFLGTLTPEKAAQMRGFTGGSYRY